MAKCDWPDFGIPMVEGSSAFVIKTHSDNTLVFRFAHIGLPYPSDGSEELEMTRSCTMGGTGIFTGHSTTCKSVDRSVDGLSEPSAPTNFVVHDFGWSSASVRVNAKEDGTGCARVAILVMGVLLIAYT